MASLLRGIFRGLTGAARSGRIFSAKNFLNPRNLISRSRGYSRLGTPLRTPFARGAFGKNLLAKSIGYPARGAYLGYRGARNLGRRGTSFMRRNAVGSRIKMGVQKTGNFVRRGAKSAYRKISADPASAALGIYQSTRTPTLELKLAGSNIGSLRNPPKEENIFNTRSFSSWS